MTRRYTAGPRHPDVTNYRAGVTVMDVLSDGLVHVALDLLDDPSAERNSRVDLGDLNELVESIRALGVLEPIGVRPALAGRYVVLFGSRRVAAGRLAGLETIPATVRLEADAASGAFGAPCTSTVGGRPVTACSNARSRLSERKRRACCEPRSSC